MTLWKLPHQLQPGGKMLITKKEGYAIKNENEIHVRAEASSQQQTSEQTNQEIVNNPNQNKAATDFAIAKRNEGQLQATLLKDRLLDINPLKETPAGLPADAVDFTANNLVDLAGMNLRTKHGFDFGGPDAPGGAKVGTSLDSFFSLTSGEQAAPTNREAGIAAGASPLENIIQKNTRGVGGAIEGHWDIDGKGNVSGSVDKGYVGPTRDTDNWKEGADGTKDGGKQEGTAVSGVGKDKDGNWKVGNADGLKHNPDEKNPEKAEDKPAAAKEPVPSGKPKSDNTNSGEKPKGAGEAAQPKGPGLGPNNPNPPANSAEAKKRPMDPNDPNATGRIPTGKEAVEIIATRLKKKGENTDPVAPDEANMSSTNGEVHIPGSGITDLVRDHFAQPMSMGQAIAAHGKAPYIHTTGEEGADTFIPSSAGGSHDTSGGVGGGEGVHGGEDKN
jgi:hypothetical protein